MPRSKTVAEMVAAISVASTAWRAAAGMALSSPKRHAHAGAPTTVPGTRDTGRHRSRRCSTAARGDSSTRAHCPIHAETVSLGEIEPRLIVPGTAFYTGRALQLVEEGEIEKPADRVDGRGVEEQQAHAPSVTMLAARRSTPARGNRALVRAFHTRGTLKHITHANTDIGRGRGGKQ